MPGSRIPTITVNSGLFARQDFQRNKQDTLDPIAGAAPIRHAKNRNKLESFLLDAGVNEYRLMGLETGTNVNALYGYSLLPVCEVPIPRGSETAVTFPCASRKTTCILP